MTRFLNSIDSFLGRIFKQIELSTSVRTEHLACFRIFFGAMLLFYFLPSWSWLNDVPPGFFNPRFFSFANLSDNFLPPTIYSIADVLVLLLLLFITLGIFTRKSLLAMFVLSSVLFSYSLSFGKIDHYTNLFLVAYPILAFTNSGSLFALRKDKELRMRTQERSLAFLGIIIAFGFFTAGIPKLLSWVDFDLNTSGFLFWFYGVYFNDQHQYLLTPYVFKLPSLVLEVGDYAAAIFEVTGFFFLLKSRRLWRIYLTIACFFHLLNLLTLNYGFTLNSLCFGVFIISPVLGQLYKKYRSYWSKYYKILFILTISIAILKLVIAIANNTGFRYHGYGPLLHIEHIMDILIWSSTILCGISLVRSNKLLH